jgi:hypothetical protein
MNSVFVQLNDVVVNTSYIKGMEIMDMSEGYLTRVHMAGGSYYDVELSLFETVKAIREAQNAVRV